MEKQCKQWQTSFWGAPKSLADGDSSHEIKRCLPLGKKVMTNLDSILKSRDNYFANKGPSSQSYGFPRSHVWMWELANKENWAPNNWCFYCGAGETLESSLDSKDIQPVHPKEISHEYSLEGLMLKLKLQYFGHLMWRADSLEKTLMLGKIEGKGRRGRQRMRRWMATPTQWTWVWVNSGSWWCKGRPGVLQSIGSQIVVCNWTELMVLQSGFHGSISGQFPLPQALPTGCVNPSNSLYENCWQL